MTTVTKEFAFDCAHLLSGYDGLCKNVHGHTYKLFVTVSATEGLQESGSSEGMVVDFAILKKLVTEEITSKFDHALVLNANAESELEQELLALGDKYGLRIAKMERRSTCEHMAEDFFEVLTDRCLKYGLRVETVRLYETPTSYAEVQYGISDR